MFTVNDRGSKMASKTSLQWVSFVLTMNILTSFSSAFIIDFEQINFSLVLQMILLLIDELNLFKFNYKNSRTMPILVTDFEN